MGLLVDTSIFIAVERKTVSIQSLELSEDLAVSVLTLGEMMVGGLQATRQTSRERALHTYQWIKDTYRVLDVNSATIVKYAEVTAQLNKDGKQIGAIDRLIAATALAEECAVLTMDANHFSRVDGLRVVAPAQQSETLPVGKGST